MESKAEASEISRFQPGSRPKSANAADVSPQNGLTSDEAHSRLEKFGPNAMPDTTMHPLRMALENSGDARSRGCSRLRSFSN